MKPAAFQKASAEETGRNKIVTKEFALEVGIRVCRMVGNEQ
tara:strand:+ start:286 stop:408 length:123 start_codon:yes stop_codon:yes gene_type:complete